MSKETATVLFYFSVILLGAAILLPYNFDFVDICPAADQTVTCVQTWVSALSGWAAFLGALLAIPFLAAQVREARRQTEFIVGDALPTASMHDPRETRVNNAFSSRLQIVNWNRHPILIRSIALISPLTVNLFHVEVEDHDAGRKNILQQEYRRGRMFVPGWVDRNKTPIIAEFDLTFETGDPAAVAIAENNLIRVPIFLKVDVVIAGPSHKSLTLLVDRPDALVVTE
ncbi:hypothetical protein NKH57_24250 [Mesorhizobium sp. M1050]|uniref:hypothetical protein n=1 Tax=Mesorhizobium sp. M1050 TaxID=2957051 RepID=UPI00333A2520